MRMIYDDNLDKMLDDATKEGKDTTIIQSIIQLYQSLNSGGLDDVNVSFPAQASSTPAGVIEAYGGSSTPPTGYLYCDGSAVSRTTYASLFAAIGTYWGVGDNSTTFNIPDLRGYYLIGVSGATYTIGANYGSSTHTHAGVDHVHGTGWADRDHSHGLGGHTHGYSTSQGLCAGGEDCTYTFSSSSGPRYHYHVGTTGGPSVGSDGQSQSHTHGNTVGADRSLTTGSTSSLPPTKAVNYIIKY